MREEMVESELSRKEREKEILLSYSFLSILSLASRFFAIIWIGVVIFLLTFPWIWSKVAGLEAPSESEKSSRAYAFGIGTLLGTVFFIYCIISPDAWDQFPPPFFEMQLLAGFIANALILVPMQEIYFRKWLLPRLEELTSTPNALILSSLLFMLWHLMPPFQQDSTTQIYIDVASLMGCLSTFILGILCGIAYIKSRRIVAPWLTHTIAGMTLVFLGKVVLFTFTE